MQTFGNEVAGYHRPIEADLAVCLRMVQVETTFDPAVADLDWPNELRVFKIDIPYNAGASDPNPRERQFFLLRRPCQQVRHKVGRDRAAFLFLGIEWEIRATPIEWCAATIVKVGPLTMLDTEPSLRRA